MADGRATRRGWRWTGWVVTVVAAIGLALAIRLVALPRYDDVTAADAIVIIGPVDPWRVDLAERLVDEGVSDVVAMTALGRDRSYCDWHRADVETMCFAPSPTTTQGEAIWTKQQIAEHGWDSVVVITVDTHVERTRFIFRSCIRDDAAVAVIGQPPPDAGWSFYSQQIPYQIGGFLKALFVTPGC